METHSPATRPAAPAVIAAAASLLCTLGTVLGASPAAAAAPPDTHPDKASATTVLVNPIHPLDPVDYEPATLAPAGNGAALAPAAARALENLLAAAASNGHSLTVESGFRSYAQQAALFAKYTAQYGEAYAMRISARPGTSEHQTGLAVDIGLASGQCRLHYCFGDTPAGQWVAVHAVDFGFIVRYPDGQEETTGYRYEPWHLRYLGLETAIDLERSGAATYEDYLGRDPESLEKAAVRGKAERTTAERTSREQSAARQRVLHVLRDAPDFTGWRPFQP